MRLFLIESKEDKQNFIDKFGQETYDLFMKSKDRLKNNKISTDIVWHTKYTTPEEMTNILTSLQQKVGGNKDLSGVDFTNKQIPGKYKYFGNIDGFEVYQPLDYISSMALGVNTGWCTTGRYGHYGEPNFKPSEEAAEEHFYEYTDQGVDFYYLLNPKTMYGEYAIAQYPETLDVEEYLDDGSLLESTNFEIFDAEDYVDYSSVKKIPNIVRKLGLELSINERPKAKEILEQSEYIEQIPDTAFMSFPLKIADFPICETIGYYAFEYCSSLTTASFPVCQTVGMYAFHYCTSLTSVSFPVCQTIGARAFDKCIALTTASFQNCTDIGRGAFGGCHSLTTASFPNCEIVGREAFYSCDSLTSVSFPNCTYIGDYAFEGCVNLLSVYLLGSSVVHLEDYIAFRDTDIWTGEGKIYVPSSLYSQYIIAPNWSYFSEQFVSV